MTVGEMRCGFKKGIGIVTSAESYRKSWEAADDLPKGAKIFVREGVLEVGNYDVLTDGTFDSKDVKALAVFIIIYSEG